VELGDRDGRNFGLLGYCYLTLESPLEAEVAYRNAVLQEPETRDWKLGLARALLAMEHYRDAVALFDALIQADPDDPTPWLLQANAYVGLDEPASAAVNLELVRMLGKAQTSTLVLLGDIYMNAGLPELAASAYLEVIRSDADGTRFTTAYRAAELLLRTRAWDDAAQVLDSIDARYAVQLSQDDELKVLTLKAKLARARGRQDEAAALLASIVQRDGTRGDALLELAAHHRERGDRERALLLIERAERLEAWEYQALLDHSQVLVADREYAEAAELLRRALQIRREPRVELFLSRLEEASR
jgi:tetratricopeptide (TPR) repeat protein